MKILKKYGWIPVFFAVFIALDLVIAAVFQPFLIHSGRFVLNDFELTCRDHPEKTWDKVFFGNSVVISAYREEVSQSGYVNLGLDYGVVRDLWQMLQKGQITIGSELVIGLSDLTLYDKFETHPTYPWHRDWYEPYVYFQRDKLRLFLEDGAKELLLGRQPADYSQRQKTHYSGSMTSSELAEKLETSRYVNLPIEDFQENMRCLAKIADYCQKQGIRLRCVWMPVNPEVEISAETRAVYDQMKAICEEKGVELLDLERALETECFYDIGHLNYEYGAYRFLEVIDPWLAS